MSSSNQRLVGWGLVLAGVLLVYNGIQQRESAVGKTESVLADLANRLDGGLRTPEHGKFIAGGAACIVAGLYFALRKPKGEVIRDTTILTEQEVEPD